MKKIIGIILIITLVICSSTITLAGQVTNKVPPHEENINVLGHLSGEIGKVYSVDISWQSMDFQFTTTGATWDPGTHTYTSVTGSWSVKDVQDNNINTITVTNHSNNLVQAILSYTPEATETSVNGKFYDSEENSGGAQITRINVDSAVGIPKETPPIGNAYLRLEGIPSVTWFKNQSGTLGKITVTIQAQA